MFNRLLFVFVFSLISLANVFGEEVVPYKVNYSMVSSYMVPNIPQEYRHLRWHRFETPNFEILSINQEQGVELLNHCEPLKSWVQNRWGFPESDYIVEIDGKRQQTKCMVICIPNKKIFEKWYRQSYIDPKLSVSKNLDGSDRWVYATWIAGEDGFLKNVLPGKIGWVNLLNYEEKNNVNLPYWAIVGMSELDNDVDQIRKLIVKLKDSPPVDPEDLFSEREGFVGDKNYRAKVACVCLLLRRQKDGRKRFVTFLLDSLSMGEEKALSKNYGWSDYGHFEKTLNDYIKKLSYDISVGRTPDMGLTWFVPRK